MMRRRLLAVVGSVLGATLLAASAVAVPPVKTEGQLTQTSTLTGVCPFAVQVESKTVYRQMDYFDKNNVRTKTLVHIDEQDVFTANGKTLIGLPFPRSSATSTTTTAPSRGASRPACSSAYRCPTERCSSPPDGSTSPVIRAARS